MGGMLGGALSCDWRGFHQIACVVRLMAIGFAMRTAPGRLVLYVVERLPDSPADTTVPSENS